MVEEVGVRVRHVDRILLDIVSKSAPPNLCHPLRGFCQCFCMAGPGVPLRSTPGFTLSPAPRVLPMFLHGWSWGSAALHPRLYAVTRSAGFANVFAWLVLGFRCAPPQALRCRRAPRVLQMSLHGWVLGFRCAPPQALRCHPLRGFKNWLPRCYLEG